MQFGAKESQSTGSSLQRNGYISGTLKTLSQAKLGEPTSRVQVEMDCRACGKRVKIRVEQHDEGLGWYTSGSLTIPLQELPLLEQAIADMRNEPVETEFADIIPFPGPSSLSVESVEA